MAKYYSLVTRDSKDSPWGVAFGDYDRATVSDERADMMESACMEGYPLYCKIITTDESQAAISERVAWLNRSAADAARG
jgi:hypothetical protein